MDKAQAIQLLTNLQHDSQSYADAYGLAIQALQGVIAIVDTEKDVIIAAKDAIITDLQKKVPEEIKP